MVRFETMGFAFCLLGLITILHPELGVPFFIMIGMVILGISLLLIECFCILRGLIKKTKQ